MIDSEWPNKESLQEKIIFVESEIQAMKSKMADLADQIRWKRLYKDSLIEKLNKFS